WSAAAAVAVTASTPEQTATTPDAGATGASDGYQTVPALDVHQVGISTPPQAHATLLGWNLNPGSGVEQLRRMMRLLSDDAVRLAAGSPALADTEEELARFPSRLTVTFGFSPQLMARLLPRQRRPRLAELPTFGQDRLQEQWGQSDVIAQVCADDPITLAHARRMLTKDARAFASIAWTQHGFRNARGTVPDGTTMRNLMGQVDGTVNPSPDDADFDGLVWSDQEGFAGGTFLVLRRIRMQMDRWDRVDRAGREATIGRRLRDGAPLTGFSEFDEPDFEATDRFGFPVIDPASHVARAHSTDPAERFLRRAYNYAVEDPDRSTGEDAGLLFLAYCADPARQFVPVQQRLDEQDRLNEWVHAIGSAVYAIPPAARPDGYVGDVLLEEV
ncbi:Dyp-type peroxidase, partial [Nocardioides dubius]